MAKLRIRYTKSAIGYSSRQKDTIRSLGLHKLQSVVIHDDTPTIRGMAFHVRHLVTVEEIDESQIEAPKKRPVTTIVLKASEQPEPATTVVLEKPAEAPAASAAPEQPAAAETVVTQPMAALAETSASTAPLIAAAATDEHDIEIIEGIGPKSADALRAAGLGTFAQIAAAQQETLEQILRDAKLYGGLASVSTWAQQAELAAAGRWDDLKELQERLNAGRETEGDTK